MPTFTVTLEKRQSKRTEALTLKRQLTESASRGVAGNRKVWVASRPEGDFDSPSKLKDGDWLYKATITFRRSKNASSDVLDKEVEEVTKFMQGAANVHKWHVKATAPSWAGDQQVDHEDNIDDFINFSRALDYEEIEIPNVLINGTDEQIEEHPAFCDIYAMAPHIRIMASSMLTMMKTKGARRNHMVLYGLPGCGKTSMFHCWQNVLAPGSFLRINSNSTTKAGLDSIFLKKLRDKGIPKIIFAEEMEKTDEKILAVWLSILDERAEVQKIIHNKTWHAKVQSLLLGTVNDKVKFDGLMGGRPGRPGALSSRLPGIYVPRPSEQILRQILRRDINRFYPEAGANQEDWVDACIDLANEVETNDPRVIVPWLDARGRLLSGDHKKDIMTLRELEKSDRKNRSYFEEDVAEAEWDRNRF